jgi:uncharacterized protein YdaU (DUF1376 family)
MKLLAEWFLTDRWMGSSGFLLPMEARGVYREMLTQAWRRGARLPNDHEAIKRAIGATDEEWARSWPKITKYWRIDGDELVNETQLEVYTEALSRAEAASKRGTKGAQARTQAQLKHSSSSAQAVLKIKPPSPSPSPSKTKTETDSPAAPGGWVSQAGEDWIERFGGTAPFGAIGKALKPLVEKHGWERVRAAWRFFLAQLEAKFAGGGSPGKFANTYADWVKGTSVVPSDVEASRRVMPWEELQGGAAK